MGNWLIQTSSDDLHIIYGPRLSVDQRMFEGEESSPQAVLKTKDVFPLHDALWFFKGMLAKTLEGPVILQVLVKHFFRDIKVP